MSERVKKDVERAWTLPNHARIIAALRKIIYETIGNGWQYNTWYTEIEHWLQEWEASDNPDSPSESIMTGLKFHCERMVEDVEWEERFQASGGDEMAKAHAFGYDI
jgi:hypothetical protein